MPKTTDIPELLTPKKAGQILGYAAKTIREWLRTGVLRGIKIRGQWRITRVEIVRFLAEHEHRIPQDGSKVGDR